MNLVEGKYYLTKKMGEKDWTDKWDDSTGKDVHTTMVITMIGAVQVRLLVVN